MIKGMPTFLRAVLPRAAAALMLCPHAACTQQPVPAPLAPAPQARKAAPVRPAKITLNQEEMGTTDDTSMLAKTLTSIFQRRRENNAFRADMVNRHDLPPEERIEKTVFVKADRSVMLGELIKVIGAVSAAGASPVQFPVEVDRAKAGRGVRDPLELVISVNQPGSPPPPGGKVISGGIPVILSGALRRPDGSAAGDESIALITISEDGGYSAGGRRVQKAELEAAVRGLIKGRPGNGRVTFIRGGEDVSYGSVQDAVSAAFAAGSKAIYLVAGDRVVDWPGQSISFALPPSWRESDSGEDGVRWEGPEGVRFSISVLNDARDPSPEESLRREYETRLGMRKEGRYEEVRWLELNGVGGILTRSAGEGGGDVTLNWTAYRKHRETLQFIDVFLSGPGSSFDQRQFELYGVLHSLKFKQ